jgi:hypothetical protein
MEGEGNGSEGITEVRVGGGESVMAVNVMSRNASECRATQRDTAQGKRGRTELHDMVGAVMYNGVTQHSSVQCGVMLHWAAQYGAV